MTLSCLVLALVIGRLGEVYAILKGTRVAQEQRDVCWRERRIGSQIQSNRCATFEELLLAREGARAWMEKPPVCASRGDGCGVN